MKYIKRRYLNCNNHDLWITSYADLVSAVLAVLVLMVSFSNIDVEKYDMVQKVIIEKKEQQYTNFSTLKDVKKRIESIARENMIDDMVNIVLNKEGLIINFDSAAQFEIAKHNLKEESILPMIPIFDEIVNQSKYRKIQISGHTDDLKGSRISNWELSALRALAIQEKLENLGLNNKNVVLTANAENEPLVEYRDKDKNELEFARSKNRRVSIIIKEANFEELK